MRDAITIREASDSDAATIAALRIALLTETGSLDKHNAEGYRAEWASIFEAWLVDGTCRFWLMYEGQALLGGGGVSLRAIFPTPARARPLEARLQNFYVIPPRRAEGLGERLLRIILAWIAAEGITRVIVHPSVRTRRWYPRFGFEPLRDEFILSANLDEGAMGTL